ncbi:MAG TPA: HAD family hydrolase [Polyangia bacterium]|nr:HAD family hydrolase [Polyangia bacterium]
MVRGVTAPSADELRPRLQAVRLLCLDVDGVMTDGHLYWAPGDVFWQRFNVRDGYGINLLRQSGVEVAILSGGDVPSARARAKSLGLTHALFGLEDKVAAFNDVAGALGVSAREAAFIGDELVDVPLLRKVAFAATVPDAVEEVRAAVHYVTRRPGGDGAVREICDLIRAAQRSPR